MKRTEDLNVSQAQRLISPRELKAEFAMDEKANDVVVGGRTSIQNILAGRDNRLLAILGPCSIHDPEAARDYAGKLAALREKVSDRIEVVMRVYFEKPRTTVGWRGLINDPHLDDSCDIEAGLRIARALLLDINRMGLPTATEFLDPIVPQYIADLVSWAAIGARTTESQTHRQMASGLSMPVGFKNGTDGNAQVAIDAMLSARSAHSFLGLDPEGRTCVIKTKGNSWSHLVLRGGRDKTNYDPQSIAEAAEKMRRAGLEERIVVDCSHGNTNKQHELQEIVMQSILSQRSEGGRNIMGVMVESNLFGGSQKINPDRGKMRYGVSVTDDCIDWNTTERMLLQANESIAAAA